MSQIFDALQKSEAARRGVDLSAGATAPELLESVERQRASGNTAGGRHSGAGVEDAAHDFPSVNVRFSPESKLVCATDGESLASEKFRFLAVRLRHLQQKRHMSSLLITSSLPEEGKSTVAANLAISLASKGQQKILLLDGDLRRPAQARQFGLNSPLGLSDMLRYESLPAMNICRLENLGLWLLAAGSPSNDPLTLMQSERLALLIDQLRTWFNWIVIDSPPVLPLGDTSIWMRLSDAILLVARPAKTQKRGLQEALGALEPSKLLGALINGSVEAASSDYYYHYYAAGKSPVSPNAGWR
jgi:capsular exopolysaccharide synthesis family protein